MEETKKMKVISFRIEEEKYDMFQAMAKAFGTTTSELFREMVELGVSIAFGDEKGGKDADTKQG